ncbi:MAG: helix-turn-helix transcriptional regulator [Clostridia bacterium]|nr:helix-turn-helix transcriptional regulator [Clostridia bacterium]
MFKKLLANCEVKQEMLAKQLNVTQALVSKWVTGKGVPKVTMVADIAAALDVSIETVVACFTRKKGE